jgi:hypothetical protein
MLKEDVGQDIGEPEVQGKVGVKSIWLNRGEGPSAECGKPVTVSSYAEADKIVYRWAQTAPKDGGYDKVDFKVTFTDGEEYEGRLDIKHPTAKDPDLSVAKHIKDFVSYYTGNRPSWRTEAQYAESMKGVNPEEYKAFLAKYDLGESVVTEAKCTQCKKPIKSGERNPDVEYCNGHVAKEAKLTEARLIDKPANFGRGTYKYIGQYQAQKTGGALGKGDWSVSDPDARIVLDLIKGQEFSEKNLWAESNGAIYQIVFSTPSEISLMKYAAKVQESKVNEDTDDDNYELIRKIKTVVNAGGDMATIIGDVKKLIDESKINEREWTPDQQKLIKELAEDVREDVKRIEARPATTRGLTGITCIC